MTKNKIIMAKTDGKRMYARVYTSEEKRKVKKDRENGEMGRKKPDHIRNEIIGEFSSYGMRVHY